MLFNLEDSVSCVDNSVIRVRLHKVETRDEAFIVQTLDTNQVLLRSVVESNYIVTMKMFIVLVILASTAAAFDKRHARGGDGWGYTATNGPHTWPEDYPRCAGKSQSPVALVTKEAKIYIPSKPFQFENYNKMPSTTNLTNTGHSVQVDLDVNAVVTNGILREDYVFHQLHFHWGSTDTVGSEHTIDHVRFPMELHLVHYRQSYGSWQNALKYKDGVAVIAIMLELSYEDNLKIQSIVYNLKYVLGPHQTTYIDPIILQTLLPDNVKHFFSYQGSLTTPACNEVVTWIVFKDSIPISSTQLMAFRGLLSGDETYMENNYRPLQPLNDRTVYRSWM